MAKGEALSEKLKTQEFSGVVHTLMYRPWQGFADYSVVTLTIKDGVVVSTEIGQPLAGFEAFAHLDIKNARLLEHMRQNYPQGFQHV